MRGTIKKCFICASEARCFEQRNEVRRFECPRCGHFRIDRTTMEDYIDEKPFYKQPPPKWAANASGWMREHQDAVIDSSALDMFKNLETPPITDKAYKLIRWLDKQTECCGRFVAIGDDKEAYKQGKRDTQGGDKWPSELLPFPYAVCWVYGDDEFKYLLDYLKEIQFISFSWHAKSCQLTLMPKGYEYLDKYRTNVDSNLGFCAMSFDQSLRPAWENAIEPAIKLAGYEAKRIDKHPHNGGIVDEILALIRRSKFIIADLTEERGGVYFEAGFAKGLGIEVIFTCQKNYFDKQKESKSGLHFDVNHFNFLLWEENKYSEFKTALRHRIEATLGRGKNIS